MRYYAKYKTGEGLYKLENFTKLPREVVYVDGYANPTVKGRAFILRQTLKGRSLVPLFNAKTNRQHKKK
jgi:hypothetical protein